MWPDDLDGWLPDDATLVYAAVYHIVRLTPHPDQDAARIATTATTLATTAVAQRRDQAAYFRNRQQFRQWLYMVALREGLFCLLRRDEVAGVLPQVPEQYRRLIWWAYSDRLGDEQLADILCVATAHARRRRRRALGYLRELLAQGGLSPDEERWNLL